MWSRTVRFLPSEVFVVPGRARDNGFTLLEVMIAVAIIAIAVVTLFGAQSQSVSIASSARFETMAAMLGQWKMSDLLLQEYEELADDAGNFGEDYPQYSWKLTVTELSEGETGLPGTADQIKALDIAVLSTLENGQEFSFRTFVYNRTQGGAAVPEQENPQPSGPEKKGLEAVPEGQP